MLTGNLMCFSEASLVGLGCCSRASPSITTYMYIFSLELGSFPRKVFCSLFLGGQIWRTKLTSSVLEINQSKGVSLHSGYCGTHPDVSSRLRTYSLGSRNAAVSQPSAVSPLQELPDRRELPHLKLCPFPTTATHPIPHQQEDVKAQPTWLPQFRISLRSHPTLRSLCYWPRSSLRLNHSPTSPWAQFPFLLSLPQVLFPQNTLINFFHVYLHLRVCFLKMLYFLACFLVACCIVIFSLIPCFQ